MIVLMSECYINMLKKHRLIALVLNSDEKCNFSLLKLCDFKNYFLNLPL